MRDLSQKRARRPDALLGGVGSCLVSFVLFPSQLFLDFSSLSGDGIQEVWHVGVFDMESVQKSVDGGRDNGWPRGGDSIHSRTSAQVHFGHGRPRTILLRPEQLQWPF